MNSVQAYIKLFVYFIALSLVVCNNVPHSEYQWVELSPSEANTPNPYDATGVSDCAFYATGDYLYFFGGEDSKNYHNDTGVVNLITNEWVPLGGNNLDIPLPQIGGAYLVQKNSTHLMLVGGANIKFEAMMDVFTFNMATLTWETAYVGQGVASSWGCSATINNTVYIFGGWDGVNAFDDTNITWTFNMDTLESKKLQLTGDLYSAREGSVCAAWGNLIYLFGGVYFNTFTFFDEFYVIDVVTNVIKKLPLKGTPPTPRSWPQAAIDDHSYYVYSGHYVDRANIATDFGDLYAFDFLTGNWSMPDILPGSPPHRDVAAFVSHNHDFYMFGGIQGTSKEFSDLWKLYTVCNPGYYMVVGANSSQTCLPCGKGSYTANYGSFSCSKCSAGTYNDHTAASTCSLCDIASYSDVEGAWNCSSCPLYSNVKNAGSISPANCSCIAGFYGSPNSTDGCQVCPAGADCLHGGLVPAIQPGWWRETTPLAFTHCATSKACLGGDENLCAYGFEGFRCADCIESYYFDSVVGCKSCPPVSVALVVIFFLLPILVFGIAYASVQVMSSNPTGSILIDYAQGLALFYNINSGFRPVAITQFLNALTFINWNFAIFSPECNLHLGYFQQTLVVLLFPLVYIPVIVVLLMIRKFLTTNASRITTILHNSINSYLLIFSIAYVYICLKTIEPFRCQRQIDGNYYMISTPSQRCYDEEWRSYLPLLILSIIGYIVAVPAWTFFEVYRHRHNLSAIASKYSTLFIIYRKEKWFWAAVVQLRRLVLVLAQLLSAPWNAALSSLFVVISVYFHHLNKPYTLMKHNQLEVMSLVIWLLLLYTIVLFSTGPDDANGAALGIITLIVCLLGLATLLFLYFRELPILKKFWHYLLSKPTIDPESPKGETNKAVQMQAWEALDS